MTELTPVIVDAFRMFTGVLSSGTCVMPLTPSQVLFDCIYYSKKTMKVGSSTIDPSSLNPTKLRITVPQSIKDMVSDFCSSSGSILPMAEVDPESVFQVRSELLDIAWEQYFNAIGKERIPDKVIVKPVPVSYTLIKFRFLQAH